MTEQTIEELAEYIINEIEKEDLKYAIKQYGCFKIKTTARKIMKMANEIDGVNKE